MRLLGLIDFSVLSYRCKIYKNIDRNGYKEVISFIAYFLNSYYSAGLIDYPAIDQLKDILPTFLTSLTVAFIMWCVSLLDWSVYLLLPIQLVLGILLAFFIYEKIKLPEYLELKQLGISLLKRK